MDRYVIRVGKNKSYGRTDVYDYAVTMYFQAIKNFPNETVTLYDTKENLKVVSTEKNHGVKNTVKTGEF